MLDVKKVGITVESKYIQVVNMPLFAGAGGDVFTIGGHLERTGV